MRGQGDWLKVRCKLKYLMAIVLTPIFFLSSFALPQIKGQEAWCAEIQAAQSTVQSSVQDAAQDTGIKRPFNMSYIYFGNTAAYIEHVDDTKGSLDHISPSYFDLNEDGTLKLTLAVDKAFIREMHDRGIKVTPFLSNHWDQKVGINALNNAEQLSSQIAAAILEYNLDGINVDIENVTENQSQSYTNLVRLLREKLPAEKSVSVAVAVNPYGIVKGWQASYDYAALAQYSDYLMLMAYDEHYQGDVKSNGSDAGPVASYKFTEDSIRAALKEVPADKLVLGIPFYGRLWKREASYGGYGISNNKVEELIKSFDGKVIYDYAQESPRAVITIGASDEKPVIFGKTLEAGTYDIWFENEASIKKKLELVDKYNLKGTGSWSLGQEAKSTWDYYSLWLDGIYLCDIQGHWAKESILTMLEEGWMIGISRTQFMPDFAVTRAQAATILVRMLGIEPNTAQDNKSEFVDTVGHWACSEIETARQFGIVEGMGNGIFEPDNVLTREQMAVMLDRILRLDAMPEAGTHKAFPDVSEERSPWSFDAISRMSSVGLLAGFPDGNFYPKNSITRGQMAVLMERSTSRINDMQLAEISR